MRRRGAGAGAATGTSARASSSILLLAYIFNFIDRQIIGILAVPIKAELGAQRHRSWALMGGIAFALFYSGLAIPIAWLADRKSRVNIIAGSVGAVEPVHRRLRAGAEFLAAVPGADGRRRSARRAASRPPTR